jgi:hypothetical protein
LLAEEFRAAGGGVADPVKAGIQFLELRSRDVAKCNNFIACKYVEKGFEHRQTGGSLFPGRRPVAQYAAAQIE